MKKNIIKKMTIVLIDAIVLMCTYFFCAYLINGFKFYSISQMLLFSVIVEVAIKVFVLVMTKNYSHIWKYRNKRDFTKLICMVVLGNFVVFTINLIIKYTLGNVLFFSVLGFAASLEILYFIASRILISIYEQGRSLFNPSGEPTMIVGAGNAGQLIYNEILNNSDLNFSVKGFIDDDQNKIGNLFCDKLVYGPISNMNSYTKKFNITNLIIAIPKSGEARIKEVVNSINYKDMNVMIVPNMSKVLSGNINTLRKVNIADLLGRKSIELDKNGLDSFIGGKTVMVTGGGGSIGSEICRQVITYKPKKLIVFDIYENSTYDLIMGLDIFFRQNPEIERPEIISLIGSVRDESRLDEIFKKHRPNIIFHAAAHKHVPLMEDSPKEAIKNNVIGTYNVCKYASKYNCDKMVMISTDKAVNPTNVMGASKRFAEMVCEAFDNSSDHTRYSMVRFGNVLGSNGSVIPLFEKQIASGGPVKVTHEEINRFFMTIPEACGLVIQSGCYASGGEKFILDMGQPVKIIDLAKKMIQLSGLTLGVDIDIEITGLRPGEKLYEELLLDTKAAVKTQNEKIFVEKTNNPFTINQIDDIVSNLQKIWKDNKKILELLKETEVVKRKSLVTK